LSSAPQRGDVADDLDPKDRGARDPALPKAHALRAVRSGCCCRMRGLLSVHRAARNVGEQNELRGQRDLAVGPHEACFPCPAARVSIGGSRTL
jgi:hypothetical protein